jgi:Protein of unknown function (DUF2914)
LLIMTGSENTRWVALSALGAAMFAIGFSFTAVACNARDVSVSEAARAADSASALPAPAASLGTVATVVNGGPSVVPAAPTATATGVKDGVGDQGLKLKRFVVTRKIENREPIASAGADFKLGGVPVYAFAELENAGLASRSIRVLFQNEDTKATVGHVKLTVPGAQAHYRTWGNTRLIRDPGHWVAVVSTADGVELGRAPFDVKG